MKPAQKLRFHDYVTMLAFMDESPFLRVGRSNAKDHRSFQLRFENACRRHRPEDITDDYLFSPACFAALGHADSVGIVLLDDIDAAFQIVADSDSIVEEMELAFSPCLDSLVLPPTTKGLFQEPVQLIQNASAKSETQQLPLLVVTRFKLAGFALLGFGMRTLEAAYRAIGVTLERVVTALRKEQGTNDANVPLYAEVDIDSIRCTLLNPQGSSEVALILRGTNYTVLLSVISALRGLAMKDLYEVSPELQSLLSASSVNKAVSTLARVVGRKSGISQGFLPDNHIFSSSYSTLAFTPTLQRPIHPANGYVGYRIQAHINSGHEAKVHKALGYSRFPESKKLAIDERSVRMVRFGRYDYEFSEATTSGLIPTPDVLSLLEDFHASLVVDDTRFAGSTIETGVYDIDTSLVVPLPSGAGPLCGVIMPAVGEHQLPITAMLQAFRSQVLGEGTTNNHALMFNKNTLRDSMESIKIPRSLRRSAVYLFESFAHHLSDPLHFDAILDLYDPLYAFTSTMRRVVEDEDSRRMLSTPAGIEQLADFVHALSQYMHTRVGSRPEHEARDLAVDFRGGLSQLIAASDAAQKTSLGVLRWVTANSDSPLNLIVDNVDTIAAVSDFTRTARATARTISLGASVPNCLASISLEVEHLFEPRDFGFFFHEVSHLIRDFVLGVPDELVRFQRAEAREMQRCDAMTERMEEIFTEAMTLQFVFRGDVELYSKYYMAQFTSTSSGIGSDDTETASLFTEVLTRLFLITEPESLQPRVAKARFIRLVKEHGHVFSEYDRLWSGINKRAVWRYTIRQFEELLRSSWSLAGAELRIVADAWKIWQEREKHNDSSKKTSDILHALEAGTPPSMQFREDLPEEIEMSWEGTDSAMSEFTLFCDVLRSYCMLNLSSPFQSSGSAQRRIELRSKISAIKAFWDLSTRQRARRFTHLVTESFEQKSDDE